jgi:hypothetical protein
MLGGPIGTQALNLALSLLWKVPHDNGHERALPDISAKSLHAGTAQTAMVYFLVALVVLRRPGPGLDIEPRRTT